MFDREGEYRRMRIDLITDVDNKYNAYMQWVDTLFKSMMIRNSIGTPEREVVFFDNDQWMFRTDHHNLEHKIILWYNISAFPELVFKHFTLDGLDSHPGEYVADMTEMVLLILIEDNPDVMPYKLFERPIILQGGFNIRYEIE